MKKLRPLGDRVLVKRIEEKEVKKGSIIIPDTAKEKPQEGEVIAVGPGKIDDKGTRHKPEITTGDHVLFGKYAGTEIEIDGKECLIMNEDDILAIID
jgi:chaperonin GroES